MQEHSIGCDWLIGGLGGAFSPSEAHVSIMDAARVPSQCPEGVDRIGHLDVIVRGHFGYIYVLKSTTPFVT